MRRILHLIKGLGRGGAEQLLASSAPYLDRSRFSYEVAYLLPWKDALVPELEAAGLPVRCLEGARGVAWVGRLRRLVRDRGVDLVHAHSPYPAVGARMALRRSGPRLVYTEHNRWPRYHRATYGANLVTFGRNDHVFAVSDEVRRTIRYPAPLRVLRMPPVETLYHGLDPAAVASWRPDPGVRAELGIPEDAPVVGTVANFTAKKNHGDLLRAVVRIREAVPDLRVVLVGRGPLEGEVRRLSAELGLNGTVVFAGFREDAVRVAGAFDVFALPSAHEGLPIALLEAMALARAVVATRVGGTAELVEPGTSGILVPAGDPAALSTEILRLLRDPALRDRLGEAARRRAARFDIRTAVRREEEVYEELLR